MNFFTTIQLMAQPDPWGAERRVLGARAPTKFSEEIYNGRAPTKFWKKK